MESNSLKTKRLLVFHPAIAPYRIDLFNELHNCFIANFYFFRKNLVSQKFNEHKLLKQLDFAPNFLTSGCELNHKGRMIRFGYLKKIVEHIPNIILCSEFSYITLLVTLFSKLFYSKIKVYSICDDSIDVAQKSSLSRRVARRICLRYLDGIILGNKSVEDWYKRHFPKVPSIVFPIIQKEERIKFILESSVPISKLYIKQFNLETKQVLLFVGRLVEVKNLNFLIDSFNQYCDNNENTVLILVGDGDKKDELIQFTKKLKWRANIIFVGRLEDIELFAWYHIADCFVLPSKSETFGAVVNEALIAGVPVLCSKLAGAEYLISDANGATFDPYSKENFMSVLTKILKNQQPRSKENFSANSLMPFTFNEKISDLNLFLENIT